MRHLSAQKGCITMKVITHNSVNPDSIQEKEYTVKAGVSIETISNNMRKQYLQGTIDGYIILDENNNVLTECCGAKLRN